MVTLMARREMQNRTRWFEHVRDNYTAPGQRFAANGVEELYGDIAEDALPSERALVEYVLRFANGKEPHRERDEFWAREKALDALPAEAGTWTEEGLSFRRWRREALTPEAVESRRSSVRRFLLLAAENRAKALRQFLARGQNAFEAIEVQMRPREIGGDDLDVEYFHVINGDEALESFASLLVLNKKREFGSNLHVCEQCQDLFIAEKRAEKHAGRSGWKYCSEACRDARKREDNRLIQRRKRRLNAIVRYCDRRGIGKRAIW